MLAVAGVAAVSLIAEYGFYLNPSQFRVLHLIDIAVVGLFLMDAVVRFSLARRKIAFLRARWPGLVIIVLIAAQIALVAMLRGKGWLAPFLEVRSVFSLAKGYIIVLQGYLVVLIVGEMVRLNRRLASYRIKPARTVIFSFLFIILVGALLLSTPRATPEGGIPVVDALFTATSSVCVTGLVVRDTGRDFTRLGQGVILGLIQIGGLGLITLTAFFAIVMRRGLGVRESLVLRGMMTFEAIGRIGRTLRYMIAITFFLEVLGAVLLYALGGRSGGTIGDRLFTSVFHSISAFCNAGFSLFSTSFERYAGDIPVNLVMTSLIIIGGLGFPVIMNAFGRRPLVAGRRSTTSRWSLHTKLVVLMTVSLLVLGTVGFLALESDGILAGKPLGEKLLASYFASVTARTAGFNTVRTAWLGLPTLFLLAGLMFIGGSPGGTAGGVKTSTFGVVFASMASMFGGKGRVELFKRRIPDRIVREALVVVAMGIMVVSCGTFVLVIFEDLTLREVLFEVVSAFGTVGLSMGITPGLSVAAKLTLMMIMLTGRIGPLTLALAIGQRQVQSLYDYPEGRVVIG
jgi:potassium uptake TrkH family protein